MRIQPTGFAVFPEYDLRVQYDSMRLLAQGERAGAAHASGSRPTTRSVFGAPFYVMAKVAGRAASDRPLYTAEGWLKELAPADQARVWWGGIESMAAIHHLDWRALGFGFVDKPELGETRARPAARLLRALPALDGARQAAADRRGGAGSGCRRTSPATSPTRSCWGDARIGNIMFEPNGTKVGRGARLGDGHPRQRRGGPRLGDLPRPPPQRGHRPAAPARLPELRRARSRATRS